MKFLLSQSFSEWTQVGSRDDLRDVSDQADIFF